MNILITGSTGFVGEHLVEALCHQGHHCVCLVRDIAKAQRTFLDFKNIDFLPGDITNPESLNNIPAGIDYVFHLAALLGDPKNSESEISAANYAGTKNLVDKLNNVRGFVFVSTPGVQGFGYKAATEDLPYNPRGPYEASKVAAEKLVMVTCSTKHIRWTILRPDFVYGPGDLRRISLYKKIARNKMYIIGDGQAILTPTYIADVVQGCLKCLNNPNAEDNIFNISGDAVTVEQFLGAIAGELNVVLPRMKIPLGLSKLSAFLCELIFPNILKKEPLITRSRVAFLTMDHGTSSQKARNLLNYKSTFSLPKGMKETINWCKVNKLL